MNYELAQKLKDAGFPQHLERIISTEEVSSRNVPTYDHRIFDLSLMGYPVTEPDYYTQGKWRSAHYFSREYINSEECDILYFPTLSELIEACGEEWQVLWKRDDGYISKSWKEDILKENFHEAKGSTPEEAVANLWLALHNK